MNWQDIVRILRQEPKLVSPAEEAIYEVVAGEIASQSMSPGLFAKAFSEAAGDQSSAMAIYIGYCVTQLKEEMRREEERLKREREAPHSATQPGISVIGEIRCRICSDRFDTRIGAVHHVRTAHGLQGESVESAVVET